MDHRDLFWILAKRIQINFIETRAGSEARFPDCLPVIETRAGSEARLPDCLPIIETIAGSEARLPDFFTCNRN